MRENIILLLKGFLIGIAKIIPGVSGAMLAISFGLYDKGINAITNFFDDIKENFKFLLPLGIGVLLAIAFGSKGILYLLDNYYLITILFFIGLICGGLPNIGTKIKGSINKQNMIIFAIIFCIILFLNFYSFSNKSNNSDISFLLMFSLGTIDAATMVIPGISGTAIMMMLGKYDLVMLTMSSLTSLSNILNSGDLLLPFVLGLCFGVIVVALIMNYLFKKFKTETYFAIFGLASATVICLIIPLFSLMTLSITTFIGLLLFVVGFVISIKLDK